MKTRIDDDAALRSKVDEAMTVYDEYVKGRAGGEPASLNGTKDEDSSKAEGAEATA
jgi:polyadenylate-binding protein